MTRTSVRVNILFVNIIKKKRRKSITGAPTPPVPALLKPKNAFPKMGVLRTALRYPYYYNTYFFQSSQAYQLKIPNIGKLNIEIYFLLD